MGRPELHKHRAEARTPRQRLPVGPGTAPGRLTTNADLKQPRRKTGDSPTAFAHRRRAQAPRTYRPALWQGTDFPCSVRTNGVH